MLKNQERDRKNLGTSNKHMFSLVLVTKAKKEKFFGKALNSLKENTLRCPNLKNPFSQHSFRRSLTHKILNEGLLF